MKERIIEYLKNQNEAQDLFVLNDKLGLNTIEEIQELERALNELVNEQIVYYTKKRKYMLYSKCANFRKGVIDINKKGFGFVRCEGEEDIHIAKENIGLALDGDTVLIEYLDYDKAEGKVLKVLERSIKNIVGEIKVINNNLMFEPKEKVNIHFVFDKKEFKNCVEGEIVVVSLSKDLGNNQYMAHIEKHIGHKDDANIDILTIAAKYEIYPEFNDSVLKQIENIPNEVMEEDKVGRRDLTDEVIFTIDGKDTKDIDDAISIIKDGDEYILKVSIADVSYYVLEGTPLDLEAKTRGTSSYLAYSVIPMLPHKLSNGICSLNPEVERCALTCEMRIDKYGKTLYSEVYPSIIKSRIKMNYDSVNHLLEDGIVDPGYEDYAKDLLTMQELANLIRRDRTNRGASDFDIDEAKIVCDEDGIPIEIKARERGEGERLIEDFMIAANEAVASTIYYMDLPGVYRVHDIPAPEKIQNFIKFCSTTGYNIVGKFDEIDNPKMFQKLLEQVKVKGRAEKIYKSLAVRSMKKAFYSENNIGHFGLASKCYTHFTSPIRRYPDLVTHRLLRTYLVENRIDKKTVNYYENILPAICKQSSDREMAAVEAEREVEKMKMAEYMENHVGQEFEGVISGVTNFGIFVELDNLVEGLIPITTLKDDYYTYNEETQILIGNSTHQTYMIGEEVVVKCVQASKENMTIDFEIEKKLEKKSNIEKGPVKVK